MGLLSAVEQKEIRLSPILQNWNAANPFLKLKV